MKGVTDEQIRELMGRTSDRSVRVLCKVALDLGATHIRAPVLKDARRRLAEIINGEKQS